MCLEGMGSTVSLLCPFASSCTGHNLSSPLSPCALAFSNTPGIQPSEGNSEPVDTWREYKTPYETTKHCFLYVTGSVEHQLNTCWAFTWPPKAQCIKSSKH